MKTSFGGSEMSFSDWKMSFLVFKAVATQKFLFLVDSHLQIKSNQAFFVRSSRYPHFPGFLKNWVFAFLELGFWKFGTEFC